MRGILQYAGIIFNVCDDWEYNSGIINNPVIPGRCFALAIEGKILSALALRFFEDGVNIGQVQKDWNDSAAASEALQQRPKKNQK